MNWLHRAFHRPRTLAARGWVFQIHLWTGLIAGLYAVMIGLSGTLLVFREQIEDWQTESVRHVEPAPEGLPLERLVETARKAIGAPLQMTVRIPEADDEALKVTVYRGGGPEHYFVNPYTAELIGVFTRKSGMLRWMERFHSNLHMGRQGRLLNGMGGLALTLMAMSGVLLWWPGPGCWKRHIVIRHGGNWKRFNWDLHNAAGFWAVGGLALVAITGAYFTWPQLYRNAVGAVAPLGERPRVRVEAQAGARPASLDAVVAAARQVDAGALFMVVVPPKATQSVNVFLRGPGSPVYRTATTVFVHPVTAEVLAVDGYSNRTTGDRIMGWIGPLHTGDFGGWPVRVVWGILGAVYPLLFFTGFILWWDRVIRKRLAGYRTSD